MARLAVLSLALSLLLAGSLEVSASDRGCDASVMEDPVSLLQQQTFVNARSSLQPAAQQSVSMLQGGKAKDASSVDFGAALAEYIAMTLFVWIGCGCAMGIAKEPGAAWILQVSLTFGFAITSLAYAVGAYSGGQINCAVTLGLVIVGNISIVQGLVNFVAQMLGSVTGALILCMMTPAEEDKTGGLGSNGIGPGYSCMNALIGEIMGTFLLMFVVLETAVNENSASNRALACVAIGFAVFLAHTVLIPIDGCSINPTRSFGPALVAKMRYEKAETFKDMLVFWVGPLVGAAAAAGVYVGLRA